MFPIRNGLKQGDALSPYFSIFAPEYDIRRVQVNQDGLKYQLLFYADPNIVEDIKIRRLKWAGHIIRMEEERIPKKRFKTETSIPQDQ